MSSMRPARPSSAIALLCALVLAAAACRSAAPPSLTPTSVAAASATPPLILTLTPLATSTVRPILPPTVPSAGPATAVYHGVTSRRAVALTFDAGADAGNTLAILATLRGEGIRATFGVTGLWVEQHRDLALSIAADGHQLINHTYHHASFTGRSTNTAPLTAEQRALELSRTETTVYHLTQRSTRPYFRPPYGDLDDSVLRDAATAGFGTVVMWSVDTLGWQGASADDILARCIAGAAPGAIYEMHVGAESHDAEALPRVIAALRAQGYAFETVDEILR
jgi:peptidoglycan/xylan/chitin deacetylase (PgdA/CDA1 family)